MSATAFIRVLCCRHLCQMTSCTWCVLRAHYLHSKKQNISVFYVRSCFAVCEGKQVYVFFLQIIWCLLPEGRRCLSHTWMFVYTVFVCGISLEWVWLFSCNFFCGYGIINYFALLHKFCCCCVFFIANEMWVVEAC